MTDNQVFKLLSKFAPARDVKIILREKKLGLFGALWTALRLWRGVPVAKIIGRKWFYGLEFRTNKYTLDPRPDSETLVEAVLRNEKNIRLVLDLGTGTGCLLSAILKHAPNATGVGIDKSWQARRVARKNIHALGLADRAEIINLSFRGLIAESRLTKSPRLARHNINLSPAVRVRGPSLRDDNIIIIANPPYIAEGDLRVNLGARHDPKIALYGGRDGLKFYRDIAELKMDAKLYLEIGVGQESAVRRIFEGAGWRFATKHKDLSGRVRVLAFI